ncbi:DUF6415 family natural product biosynthesis protein [Streptomyces sp. NPDC127033]|uniref:DUF6415 family natural product biosynthesis protein n=1 Tax=Streptomyces sp. NPDC127033 TaxID=3347110 RepID=UPI003649E260
MSGPAATVDEIRAVIDRAHAAGLGTGSRGDLTDLAWLLQRHIEGSLLPAARADADRMWRGGTDWISLTGRLDRISRLASEGLRQGVLGAHVHVRTLAVDCQWLLERYGQELAGTGATR